MQRERHPLAVSPERLRARCDANTFSFETTATLPPPARMVGQDRAAEALLFGLGVPDSRYNIFLAGPPGSGRSISAEDAVRRLAATLPTPEDWCYVHNFETPYAPRAIALPAGQARPFAKAITALIASARQAIRASFESEIYRKMRAEALRETEANREKLGQQLDEAAAAHGFAIQNGDNEPSFVPLKPAATPDADAEPYTQEDFDALADEDKQRINFNYEVVQNLFITTSLIARRLVVQAKDIVRQVDRTITQEAVRHLFDELRGQYRNLPMIAEYLTQVQEDVVTNAQRLRAEGDGNEPETPPTDEQAALALLSMKALLGKYTVNVLVDRTGQTGAPVVHEHNPTYYNVAGRLEYGQRYGNVYTDFSYIQPGVLHQANGGFLIMHVKDISTTAWDALKRSVRTKQITLENLTDQQQQPLSTSLKPDPIPLKVKVVLVGAYEEWGGFYANDPDFAELFKVRADFDDMMPRNPQTELYYALFAGDVAREMAAPPLDRAAVARLVEEGSRMAASQVKLSTSLSDLRDLVIEAAYWAQSSQSPVIMAAHFDQATKTRHRRLGIILDRLDDEIRQGRTIITTSGATVGQINGLGVNHAFDVAFGRPFRITGRVAPGLQGVTAIERETDSSGSSHTKGVLTLAGFLAGQFGQEQPLSLTATLAIEQSYGGIDGDSASMAELCVLLSALANVPIRQNLAMTGSVNQWGEAQAIGGVAEKIEGFFDVCLINGLTGDQGVIIPQANVRDLMLRLDIVEAVRTGAFAIYTMRHVDDAVELLMGRPAGRRGPDGLYLQGTINSLVTETLRLYAERVRSYRQQV